MFQMCKFNVIRNNKFLDKKWSSVVEFMQLLVEMFVCGVIGLIYCMYYQ